jgi:hypothetical protein
MMPIGVPKVAYRVPGSGSADWVDIYNRLYRERIIFLGSVCYFDCSSLSAIYFVGCVIRKSMTN